jgi:hypothetical protein
MVAIDWAAGLAQSAAPTRKEAPSGGATASGSEGVVQAQIDAFNARDVERYAACFASNASVTWMDGSHLAEGSAQIREVYGSLFDASPDLHANVLNRMVVDDIVIDEEHLSGVGLEGYPAEIHAVAAYKIVGGKIARVVLMT